MNDWEEFFKKARQAGVSAERAAQLANEEFPRDKPFPGSTVPKAVATPWPNPISRLPPMPKVPDGQIGDWVADENGVPSWVRRRQTHAANALDFQPPKRDKALPLDPEQISDAFTEHFVVIETRELDGLDVWFVLALKSGTLDIYEIILYEHMGEWVCSSITLGVSNI